MVPMTILTQKWTASDVSESSEDNDSEQCISEYEDGTYIVVSYGLRVMSDHITCFVRYAVL